MASRASAPAAWVRRSHSAAASRNLRGRSSRPTSVANVCSAASRLSSATTPDFGRSCVPLDRALDDENRAAPEENAGAAQREVEVCKTLGYLSSGALSCHSRGASVTIGRQSGCHDLLGGRRCRL
jgi:hypothetical protein